MSNKLKNIDLNKIAETNAVSSKQVLPLFNKNNDINNDHSILITPLDPWILVSIEEGVSDKSVVTSGIAEIMVEDKFTGKHMDICRIIELPESYNDSYLKDNDLIAVWSTAVEKFSFTNNLIGDIYMVRLPDVFCKVSEKIL